MYIGGGQLYRVYGTYLRVIVPYTPYSWPPNFFRTLGQKCRFEHLLVISMNPEYQKTYGSTSSWNEDEKKMYKGGANFTGGQLYGVYGTITRK